MNEQKTNLEKQLIKLEEQEQKRLETNINIITFISSILGIIADGFTTYFCSIGSLLKHLI